MINFTSNQSGFMLTNLRFNSSLRRTITSHPSNSQSYHPHWIQSLQPSLHHFQSHQSFSTDSIHRSNPPTSSSTLPNPTDLHQPNLFQTSLHEAKGGPIDLYRSRVQAGILREDAHQVTIVNKLQDMYNHLVYYNPTPIIHSQPHRVEPQSGWVSFLDYFRHVTSPNTRKAGRTRRTLSLVIIQRLPQKKKTKHY